MRRLLALAVVFVCCLSCAGQNELTGDRRDVGVITEVFTASPAQAEAGQPVQLRIRMSDNAGTAQTITSPSAQLYDFWVRRGSREVWRWSSGQTFVQQLTTTELPAESSKIFTEVWHPDKPGRYTVYGAVTANGFDQPLKGTVVVQ